jgi:hypothetical protein
VHSPEERGRRLLRVGCPVLLAAYFAAFAADGLHAYFTADDGGCLLHMHEYWEHSAGDMAVSALRVVTPAFRPMGGIYYFVLYSLAGFHPLPFRAVCLGLMLCNLTIAFALLRRLSGSIAASFIGCVLFAHHPALLWLYYSSATIDEILCFLFYYSALLLYVRWRQSGAEIRSWRRVAVLLALTAAALDSKEMAMTLPAALFLFELIYFPQGRRSWRGIAATTVLVVPAIAAKVLTHNPLGDDPHYAIRSAGSALDAMRGFLSALLYCDLYGGNAALLFLLCAAVAGVAFVVRSRPMAFGLGLLITSLSPVLVIGPRGGYMLYLPLVGWALVVGSTLIELGGRLRRRLRLHARLGYVGIGAAAAIIAVAHARMSAPLVQRVQREQAETRRIVQQLRELRPRIDGDAFLLLRNDPLPSGWTLAFLTQLAYANPQAILERTNMIGEPTPAEMSLYDHVFNDDGFQLREVGGGPRGTQRQVAVEFLPPQVRVGGTYQVSVPELAGQTIDVAIRSVRKAAYVHVVRKWCTLDGSGRAALKVGELAAQTIYVLRVRSQTSPWLPASGSITVVR